MNTLKDKIKEKVEKQIGGFKSKEAEKGLNTIYILKSEKEDYILKIHTNPENKIEWFKAEPEIYKTISREIDIPSPDIVYENLNEDEFENAFYLMEKMEGQNPQQTKKDLEQQDLEQILHQFGQILGEIHKIQLTEEYGIQGYEKGKFRPPEPSEQWNWAMEGAIASWKSIINEKWDNSPEIKHDEDMIKEILPDKPAPVLVHSDNRFDNLLIQNTEITAFLDWSHPWSGHRLYDLARAEYLLTEWDLESWPQQTNTETLQEKLREGYKQKKQLPESWQESDQRQIYRYATTLWLAAGFANWGSNLEEKEHTKLRNSIIKRIKEEIPKQLQSKE